LQKRDISLFGCKFGKMKKSWNVSCRENVILAIW